MTDDYIQVHRSDLEKIRQAAEKARRYFFLKDEMNAAQHMADVVYSPLASALQGVLIRLDSLLDGQNTGETPTI